MERLTKMLEDIMVAITFAEAGEFDEANKIVENNTNTTEIEASSVTKSQYSK